MICGAISVRSDETRSQTIENVVFAMKIGGYNSERQIPETVRLALSRLATVAVSAATIALLLAPRKAEGALVALQPDNTPKISIATNGRFGGWIDIPTAPLQRGELETVRFHADANTGPMTFTSSLDIGAIPSGCTPLQKPPVRQLLCETGGTHSAGIQIDADEPDTSALFTMTTWVDGVRHRVVLKEPIISPGDEETGTVYFPMILRDA